MATTCELDLPSGRRLYLQSLQQSLTYEGLLEGLPTAEGNVRRTAELLARHRDKPYPGGPFLVRPVETPIDWLNDRPYPFGTPSALPSVTCVGRFHSLQPARDMDCDFSGLVVIWFQEEFAFPIDPTAMTQLKAIDWGTHAADMYY